jgi:hypothetical protein
MFTVNLLYNGKIIGQAPAAVARKNHLGGFWKGSVIIKTKPKLKLAGKLGLLFKKKEKVK